MNLVDAFSRLRGLKPGTFQTSDAAVCLGVTRGAASKILSRLADRKLLVCLTRGRWGMAGKVDRLAVPEALTAPWPSYVSLQSALFHHGMIEQIPEVIYAVSLSRARRFENALGVYSIHQVQPDFFWGFDTVGPQGLKIATPEKALLDVLYLSTARSRLFKRLPELELTKKFSVKRAREMIGRIKSPQRRSLVASRFEAMILNLKRAR